MYVMIYHHRQWLIIKIVNCMSDVGIFIWLATLHVISHKKMPACIVTTTDDSDL